MPFDKPPAGLNACELTKWLAKQVWSDMELSSREDLSSSEIGLTERLVRSIRNAGNEWSIVETPKGREEFFTGADLYMVIIDSQGRSMALHIQSKRLHVGKGIYDAFNSDADDDQLLSLISYSEVDRFELGIRAMPIYLFYNYFPPLPDYKAHVPFRGDVMRREAQCCGCSNWCPIEHFGITMTTAYELRAIFNQPLNKLSTVHSVARPFSCLFCCDSAGKLSVRSMFKGFKERVPGWEYFTGGGADMRSVNYINDIAGQSTARIAERIVDALEEGADVSRIGDVVIYDDRRR